MKIFFFAPRYHTNQIEIVRILKNKGHDITFCVINKGLTEDYSLLSPIVLKPSFVFSLIFKLIKKLNNSEFKKKYLIPSVWQIVSLFKKNKPDIIIIRNPYYIPSIFMLILAKIFSIKIILYTQWKYYKKYIGNKEKFLEYLNIIFNCKSFTPVQGNIYDNFTLINDHFIPFPISIKKKSNKNKLNKKFKNILCIGKFESRKNHILLIKAIKSLKNKIGFLTIVGEVTSEQHKINYFETISMVNTLGLENKVMIFKNIPYCNINRFYEINDIFILPSENEPFSISVLEALSYGLPVICSDTCGSQWYIEDGNNGYIFKTNDLNDLIKKIELSIENYEKLSKNSLIIAREKYNAEIFYKNFSKLIY